MNQDELKKFFDLHGVTFADCKQAFATPNDHPAIVKAREQWHREGEIEIDDNTMISGSDAAGEYVLAWVWVDLTNDEMEEE